MMLIKFLVSFHVGDSIEVFAEHEVALCALLDAMTAGLSSRVAAITPIEEWRIVWRLPVAA